MGKRSEQPKIGEVIEKIRALGLSYAEGARRFGVKANQLYNYNHRLKQRVQEGHGKNAAEDDASELSEERQQVTEAGEAQLPEAVQELICSYRRQEPTHGFKRIADLLKQKYLVVVSRKQIRRVLKEAGLLETCDSSFDHEPTAKGTRRFEAPRPGELWQMDVAYVYIRKIPVLYLVVVVDDYSRFCVAAQLCQDQRADTLIGVLHMRARLMACRRSC